MSNILKLSASSIKKYEQCPRMYYFNYIEKAPKKQWDHFDLGNLCHRTLEIFHEIYMKDKSESKSFKKSMGYSFSKARQKFGRMSDVLLLEAKNMLMDYLKVVEKNGVPEVREIETFFEFNITDDIILRGFLDRLDIMKNGRFCIIDYKTTKNKKYLDNFQLLIYGLWLKEKYPNIKRFDAAYVLLRHSSSLKSYTFNNEDLNKVRKKIIDISKSIREETTWTPDPDRLCHWCDFLSICPSQQQDSW